MPPALATRVTASMAVETLVKTTAMVTVMTVLRKKLLASDSGGSALHIMTALATTASVAFVVRSSDNKENAILMSVKVTMEL